VGPIRILTSSCIAICCWFAVAPTASFGQPNAQFPYGGNPWAQNPTQFGAFPSGGVPAADAGALTFRQSTAPGFAPNPNAAPNPYAAPNAQAFNLGNFFGLGQPVAPAYGGFPTSPGLSPYGYPNQPPTQPFGQPFPSGVYPNSSPNVLFPDTGGSPSYNSNPYQLNPYQTNPFGMPQNNMAWNNWWNSTGANLNAGTNQVIRLFQGPRFRHTWLSGSDGFDSKKPNSLETNDSDVSLVFAIPNFLNSNRPLYLIPSYSQHVWEGPTAPGSDLPGSAFSAFLDAGWETNPQQTLGVELGVRVGVFSAFDAVNSESVRIQGKALGRLRLTPTSTLRAGVFYLDRNKIKLLPAGGILWTPNPDSRFDLFFPEPKLSHYVSTLGNSDVWWYLSGYYGGGAWTIKQTDDSSDEIDINDIRLMLGLEFGKSEQIRQGFRKGFIEAGYAFNRELIYRVRSSSSLDLENSFVLRAGFAY